MVEANPQTHSEWWPNVWDPLRRLGTRVADFFSPPSDAAATDDSYIIDIDLPGVKKDDITVELTGNMLTVKGHKQSSREEKGKAYFYAERSFGAFQRSFKIPKRYIRTMWSTRTFVFSSGASVWSPLGMFL